MLVSWQWAVKRNNGACWKGTEGWIQQHLHAPPDYSLSVLGHYQKNCWQMMEETHKKITYLLQAACLSTPVIACSMASIAMLYKQNRGYKTKQGIGLDSKKYSVPLSYLCLIHLLLNIHRPLHVKQFQGNLSAACLLAVIRQW